MASRPPRPPPPAWIGLGPPVAGGVLLVFRGAAAALPAWAVLGSSAIVVAILELIASLTRARGERDPALQPVSDAGVGLARLLSVALASMEAMIAVAIGLGELQAIPLMVAAGLLMVLVSVLLGVQRISGAMRAVRAAGHAEKVKGYGLVYWNKDDPRIWVPKLSGPGATLNFAHPVSWLILAAFLVVPVGAVVLVGLSVRLR